ncbi:DUF397 domain-containing protein [Streptomyces sp. NPDC048436]|uniref:DUF397 domain-containing protein n=1 Tax=Streptomyces sp. NPDC048436 TaxID=3365550 RepID=UPI00371CC357
MAHGQRLDWFKSSYSGGSGTECVEAAFTSGTACVRDSKSPELPYFAVRHPAWTRFIHAFRAGGPS